MLNASSYRLQSPTSPSFSAASDVTPRATTQSMFNFNDVDARSREYGFTRSRLPSSEHVTFSSDGRFLTPETMLSPRRLPRVPDVTARMPDVSTRVPDVAAQAHTSAVDSQRARENSHQIRASMRPQHNPFQQFHLRNSDFYSSRERTRYANATTERQRYSEQYGCHHTPADDVTKRTSPMVESYSILYGGGSEQYYHSIGTGLRRS